jgi:hypothetical protein
MIRRALTMTRSIFFKKRSIKTLLAEAHGQIRSLIIKARRWVGKKRASLDAFGDME